jgi:hypothetical protein
MWYQEVQHRIQYMSLYWRKRNDSMISINPQLQALKKETENHQTSFGARSKIRGAPRSISQVIRGAPPLTKPHQKGVHPIQTARQHTQRVPFGAQKTREFQGPTPSPRTLPVHKKFYCYVIVLLWNCSVNRARIFKHLLSPGIDSKEWISPAYVAWRDCTITLFLFGS